MTFQDDRPTYGPHPDAVLLRQWRTRRAATATKLAIALVTPFEASAEEKKLYGVRRNPVNESQLKERTCAKCGVTYTGVGRHFGHHHATVCLKCRGERLPGANGNAKGQTCIRCGELRYPMSKMYRERQSGGVRSWTKICRVCLSE